MTTAADRLRIISKSAGVSAATMLLLVGSGLTAGDALANYSRLTDVQAQEHILVDRNQGGGYSETKKRKRNIVEHDGKLYVFSSDRKAIDFINAISVDNPEVVANKPAPEREISISEVKTLEQVFKIPESKIDIKKSIQFADYQAVIAAYDRWLELDEEEALLLLI